VAASVRASAARDRRGLNAPHRDALTISIGILPRFSNTAGRMTTTRTMPPSPALTTNKSSSKLASLAWFVFKLGFGLFSLTFTWVTVAWKNGVFQPKDTDEEKKELEAGMLRPSKQQGRCG
jgi:apolipoprotein N-acyltransferase